MIMDDKTAEHLWALRKVNEALIEGLKTAIFVLKNKEELSKERKRSMIESLKGLIAQSDEIYGEAATKHGVSKFT